MIMQVIS